VIFQAATTFLLMLEHGIFAKMDSKERANDEEEVKKLISLGVDAEFARMLPLSARKQILNGILGLSHNSQTRKARS
jgi:hypothetical protein